MDEHLNDMDLIDRMLLRQLTPEEQREVEERIKRDPEFAKEVEDAKSVVQVVMAGERERLWKQLSNENSANDTKQRFLNFSPTVWAVAAAILVGVMIGGYWWNGQSNYQELYDAYYAPYGELSFPRSRGASDSEKLLQEAADLYQEKKYDESIKLLTALEEKDDRHYFVLGLALMQQKEFEKALDNFGHISGDFEFIDEVRWYQGLIFLAMNEPEKAKETLLEIKSKKPRIDSLINKVN